MKEANQEAGCSSRNTLKWGRKSSLAENDLERQRESTRRAATHGVFAAAAVDGRIEAVAPRLGQWAAKVVLEARIAGDLCVEQKQIGSVQRASNS